MSKVQVSSVVQTLLEQLNALNPLWRVEYQIKNVVVDKKRPNWVRLCSRLGQQVINIDISYNEGTDLYDIKAYRLRNYGLDIRTVYDEEGIYAENLNCALVMIVFRPPAGERVPLRKPVYNEA